MYQHPVVFLIDKSFSESYMSVDTSQLLAETVHRGKLVTEPHESFVRYAVTDDGISGYTVPGTPNGEFIATSYEHDIYGKETEDESIKIEMENQRFLKMETFVKNEFGYGFSGFDIVNPGASKFFVTYGINYYGISGYTQGHLDENWGIILLKVIQPLDPGLKIFLDAHTESIDRLVFIEQNQSGQLETYLIPRLGLLRDRWDGKISHVRSQSFYPIFPESL